MAKIPDMSDSAVLDMVLRNHYPHEEWDMSGDVLIHCEKCRKDWPCPTIITARSLAAKRAGYGSRRNPR